ncbi:microviridin/marinostatin family tricyclic proteinase inhibitor [Flavobacterium lindanitolerans]|nr:microviridin/marinostatin family tricyclic proteinase inhibitor [Flavobacterium lindanitolerans]
MENDKKLKKPFFANFLESQVPEKEMEQINGGTDAVTMKFPSDGEDGPGQ